MNGKIALRIAALVSGFLILACSTTPAVTPTVLPTLAPPTSAPSTAVRPTATLAATVTRQPSNTPTGIPKSQPSATFTQIPPSATFTPIPPTATFTPVPTNPPIKLSVVPRVVGRPDLYVSEFQLTPNPPNHSQMVHVRIGVYNKGNAAATVPFKVEWWAGSNYPSPACMWTINSLAASGGQILECDKGAGTWASGYAKITTQVRVDPGGAVTESNEGNNVHSVEISVK